MTTLDQYLEDQSSAFEEDLCQLLRIPSVSADSRHKPDVRRAAEWVADQFRGLGFATELVETAGHPVIRIRVPDPIDLGAEFIRWEVATAIAGAVLGIDPFDQPAVELAKKLTKERLA